MPNISKEKIILFALITTALVLVFYLVFSVLDFKKSPAPISPSVAPETEETKETEETEKTIVDEAAEILSKIIRKGSIEHEFAEIKTYDIVIGKVNKEEVESAAQKLVEEITKEDNEIDEIHLIFFSEESLIETQPFDVAEAIWGPKEEMTDEIAKNNLRDNYEIRVITREELDKAIEELPE